MPRAGGRRAQLRQQLRPTARRPAANRLGGTMTDTDPTLGSSSSSSRPTAAGTPWRDPILAALLAALVAAECMTFEAALKFVYRRAQWISEKVGGHRGRALTLMGLSEEQLRPSLSREEGEIHLTHRLAPDCFVVWGSELAVGSLALEIQGAPGLKVLPATARGPLHTPLAAEWEGDLDVLLTECMGGVGMKHPKVAVHRVSDGEYLGSPDALRDTILRQYSRPVDWTATVHVLLERGLRSFVELGPGKVYTTLVKRIDSNTRIANVEDIKSLAMALKVTL